MNDLFGGLSTYTIQTTVLDSSFHVLQQDLQNIRYASKKNKKGIQIHTTYIEE
jgi:hypothetical protein